MIGQDINHFQITAKLGRDGLFGDCRAKDTTPKRHVNIKIPSRSRSRVPGAFSWGSQKAAP